jgi:hypothetical protein
MASKTKWRLRGFAASTTVLLGAMGFAGSGCNDDGVATVECESTRTYFAQNVWGIMESKCIACHNPQGDARETKFILKGAAEAGFIDANLATIKDVSSLTKGDQSWWLLKPTGEEPHQGGVQVAKGSDEYKAMLGLVVRLKDDQPCQAIGADTFAGVELAGAELTLRKAAIILAGRLPTDEELARVRDGGFPALEGVLDEMMTEEGFFDFVKSAYGDLFQTDFYLRNDAAGQIADSYPNAFWFMDDSEAKAMVQQYGLASLGEVQRFTEHAIAREPLELIEWVVKNDLPFSEILTANYMMFSPFSAKSFGVAPDFSDDGDPFEFAPASLAYDGEEYGFPHAGVLTSPMFLSRWPTTPTNRNRARSRVFMLFFLGTDILKTAEQPVDQTSIKDLNPTRNSPQCTVCHTNVDPIAGAFQAFDEDGVWDQDPTWYPEMFPPGFGSKALPIDQSPQGLQWLARQAVQDERFTLSVVYNLYRGLTGREPLAAPTDHEDPLYGARFDAFLAQANVFHEIGEKFKQSNMNAKVIVKELVLSPYFRGVNAVTMDPMELAKLDEVGLGRLLPPEMLHNKIDAIFGVPWANGNLEPRLVHEPRNLADTGTYQLFYGGIDFVNVNSRITDPNGLMAAVGERMAMEMSCFAVPTDFSRLPADRRLFKTIDIDGVTYDPKDLAPESGGLAVPQAVAGIKQTIANLHFYILGEQVGVDHPEVERTYQLFLETWREGTAKLAADELSENLPGACRVETEFFSGTPLPEGQQVIGDDKYTIRAWMAVMTYLISDYKFLYE